jgi:hypothetical protein
VCAPAAAGLCSPTAANGGFSREGKQVVVKHLRKVLGGAHSRMSVRTSRMIAHARIPVLKLELTNGIELDVSLNDGSGGVSAANFLQSWVRVRAGWGCLLFLFCAPLLAKRLPDASRPHSTCMRHHQRWNACADATVSVLLLCHVGCAFLPCSNKTSLRCGRWCWC